MKYKSRRNQLKLNVYKRYRMAYVRWNRWTKTIYRFNKNPDYLLMCMCAWFCVKRVSIIFVPNYYKFYVFILTHLYVEQFYSKRYCREEENGQSIVVKIIMDLNFSYNEFKCSSLSCMLKYAGTHISTMEKSCHSL